MRGDVVVGHGVIAADEVPGGDGGGVGDLAGARSSPRTRPRARGRSARLCSVASGAGAPASSPLARHTSKRWSLKPVGEEQRADPLHPLGPHAGLLGELAARERLGVASGASSHAPCGQLPEAPADRVAVLLDEPHVVVLERDDDRGRRFLDPRVEAGRAVGMLVPVLVQADPAVLVDDAGRLTRSGRARVWSTRRLDSAA